MVFHFNLKAAFIYYFFNPNLIICLSVSSYSFTYYVHRARKPTRDTYILLLTLALENK